MIELTVGGRSVLFHDRPNLLHVVHTSQLHSIQSVTSASRRLSYCVAGPVMNWVHQVQLHEDTQWEAV